MTTPTRPLDRFPLARAQDAEEMCAALAGVYAKPEIHLRRGTRTVDTVLNYCQLKHIGLGYTKYGVDMGVAYPESSLTLQTFPIRGRGQARVGRSVSTLNPARGVSISPGTNFAVKLDAEYEHCLVVLNTKSLTGKLAALTEKPIDQPLRFDPTHDPAPASASALRQHSLFLIDSVSNATLPDLVLEEFQQTLLMMVLHANRHNYSQLLEERRLAVAPWQIRRAEEFIAANWNQPIRVEEVADAAGVHDLALFRALKQRRGKSATAFAKDVRLSRASELLRHPETLTIAEIAAACGFADPATFAADYAKAFGEAPSQTRGRDGAGNDPAKH
jgi:AraC-like DNA-binding protein